MSRGHHGRCDICGARLQPLPRSRKVACPERQQHMRAGEEKTEGQSTISIPTPDEVAEFGVQEEPL